MNLDLFMIEVFVGLLDGVELVECMCVEFVEEIGFDVLELEYFYDL